MLLTHRVLTGGVERATPCTDVKKTAQTRWALANVVHGTAASTQANVLGLSNPSGATLLVLVALAVFLWVVRSLCLRQKTRKKVTSCMKIRTRLSRRETFPNLNGTEKRHTYMLILQGILISTDIVIWGYGHAPKKAYSSNGLRPNSVALTSVSLVVV